MTLWASLSLAALATLPAAAAAASFEYGKGPYYPTPFDEWLNLAKDWPGPSLQKWVHYFEPYERHFSRFRGTPVVVLEIGIKDGGSLALWRKYFGESARLFGADLFEGAAVFKGNPRYGTPERIILGDQGSDSFWEDVRLALPGGTLDILIDDGSHAAGHQVKSMEMALQLLRPGGVYFCEDVHGARNGFLPYLIEKFIYSTKPAPGKNWYAGGNTTLNAFKPMGHMPANTLQQQVFALTIYPFVAVVEMLHTPRTVLHGPVRGHELLQGSNQHGLNHPHHQRAERGR